MSLPLGDLAPNFTTQTSIGEIDFYEYLGGSWGVLFSHPADFTPVCTTEPGKTALLKGEFDKRNVKALALSADLLDKHIDSVAFPLTADQDGKISLLYDMTHPNASARVTVRSLFIISPDKKLKLTITYPASAGRNFNEVLRVIDSLQLKSIIGLKTKTGWFDKDAPQNLTYKEAGIRGIFVVCMPVLSAIDWNLHTHTMFFIAPLIMYLAVSALTMTCPVKELFSRSNKNDSQEL